MATRVLIWLKKWSIIYIKGQLPPTHVQSICGLKEKSLELCSSWKTSSGKGSMTCVISEIVKAGTGQYEQFCCIPLKIVSIIAFLVNAVSSHAFFIYYILSALLHACLSVASYFIAISPNVLSSLGYPTIQVELDSPTGLRFVPPAHSHQDDFFSDFSSLESPLRTPSRLSDVLVTSQGNIDDTAAAPPMVIEEDISLEDGKHDFSVPREGPSKDDTGQIQLEEADLNDYPKYLGSYTEMPKQMLSKETSPTRERTEQHEREKSGTDEMTEEKLKSLFEDIHLEEVVESEEMTEEKVWSILKYVQQAEQDISSITGWQSEPSNNNVEPSEPGRRISGELLDRLDDR